MSGLLPIPGIEPLPLYLCHGCDQRLPASAFHRQRDHRRPRAYCRLCRSTRVADKAAQL